VSAPVRPTTLLLAALLALALTACGADNPPGTISEDDLPSSVKVDKVRHDVQAGQVVCPDANDAEDNHVMSPSENSDKDRRAAVAYELSGSDHQEVSNSVWRLSDPQAAVEQVAAGVDTCIKAHPDVQEVCVIGTPDPVWAQNVRAVIVLRDGAACSEADIIEHCRARIASYKKPKSVVFTPSLPKNAYGFVDRAAVDVQYEGGGYPKMGA